MKFSALPFLLFFIATAFSSSNSYAQVYGCKDPLATNYNPLVTNNDGSCIYASTDYTPPVKVDPMNNVLLESSGLQWANNGLWSFNDGGGIPAIYRIDTITSTLLQTVTLAGAANIDWEDIAFDGTFFYIGDFGNNAKGSRNDLKIYKFPISAIPDYTTNPSVTIAAGSYEVINFIYADQQQPPVDTLANTTRFDCEAMIVDGGKIHLFSKNWKDVVSTHYVINGIAAGNYTATPVETLATGYLVTAADKAPGENVVALLGYQAAGVYPHFMHILSDYNAGLYFSGNKRKINTTNVFTMGQAEGLTFRNATYGYISNEAVAALSIPQRLRYFNIQSFISPTVLSSAESNFAVGNSNGVNTISWHFVSEVNNLQVQYSNDGSSFGALVQFPTSTKGTWEHLPASSVNYYRLSWQNKVGTVQYSKVISVKNDALNFFSQIVLTKGGKLSFTLGGNQAMSFAMHLTGSDGRRIASLNAKKYYPGSNTVNVPLAGTGGTVFITFNNSEQKITKAVFVQ